MSFPGMQKADDRVCFFFGGFRLCLGFWVFGLGFRRGVRVRGSERRDFGLAPVRSPCSRVLGF